MSSVPFPAPPGMRWVFCPYFWHSKAKRYLHANVRHHIRKIYEEHELVESSTCKQDLQVQQEGDRTVQRKVDFYNLDVILSVGYRVSSQKATAFRQWANRTLRQFITRGYALNDEVLDEDYVKTMSQKAAAPPEPTVEKLAQDQ